MKKIMVVLFTIVVFSLWYSTASATPVEWHNSPKTGTDAGEIFSLKFEIKSDETANYTITLDNGTQFSMVDGNNSMTINIPKDATRTYIFDMKIAESLENGKHPIHFVAYKEGVEFKTGIAYVRAGEQAPGFETIVLIGALVIAVGIWKKKKHLPT